MWLEWHSAAEIHVSSANTTRLVEHQQMDFFCTCGRGTEVFAVAEISQLLNEELEKISVRDGKVFFTLQHINRQASFFQKTILQLKSVERVFVGVFHKPDMKLFSQKQALWKLKSELQSVDTTKWESCFQLWKIMQLADESNIPTQATELCGATSIISDTIHACDNSEQLDMMENESSQSSVTHLEKRGQKRLRDEVTFRVSAKCSGTAASWFTPQNLSRVVGCEIARRNGWTPELRKPALEICVQLNHDGLIVGFPCTSVPLSIRRYMKHPGLRTTISSIMVSLAALEPGMVLLDPMCGMGTILIEAAKQCSDVLCIGCDRDIQQCHRSVENVRYSKEVARVSLMQADVSDIPLASGSVDVVVCDIPFGIKHEAPVNVSERYQLMLLSIDRVLKREGRVVFLCGAKLKDALLTSVKELFSSQTHAPLSPSQTSTNPHGIDSSEKVLQKCISSSNNSPNRESCDTLKHTDNHKDGSLECEPNNVEKTVSDSLGLSGCGPEVETGHQHVLCETINDGDVVVDDCHSSGLGNISTFSSSTFAELTPSNKSTLDTILRLCRRPSNNTSANNSHSCNGSTIGRNIWVTELVHYVKLGETHAFICVFSTKTVDV